MYAMKCYQSPHYIMSEFETDINRTKYLKRLFRRYKNGGSLKERLVLNHLILLNNVFGPEATTRILFYKIEECDYDVLKTFLCYLNIMPETVMGIKGRNISSYEIPMDGKVAEVLLNI